MSQYKLKDQSTFFGLLWSIFNPLLMVGVLFVFFNRGFGADVPHYGVYLVVGMVLYTHFANATSAAMRVLLTMKPLTRDTVFPKELLVLSSVLSGMFDLVAALLVCVAAAYLSGIEPAWIHLLLPGVVLLQFLLVVWVSLLLACLFPFARDIEHLYQVFLRALLFLTPIFYAPALLGDGIAQDILLLNPLAHVMAIARGVLIDGHPGSLLAAAVITGVNASLTWIGWRVFTRYESRLAEYV